MKNVWIAELDRREKVQVRGRVEESALTVIIYKSPSTIMMAKLMSICRILLRIEPWRNRQEEKLKDYHVVLNYMLQYRL